MKRLALAATAALLGTAPPPATMPAPEEIALFRSVLAQVGPGYCVTAALTEAPFANLRRERAEYAQTEAASDRAAGSPAADAVGEQAALRAQVGWGWTTDVNRPLDVALQARIVAAATAIALRGDPAPVPPTPDTIVELNAMDAADMPPEPAAPLQADSALAVAPADALEAEADRLEALADAAAPSSGPVQSNHGIVDPAWLPARQRLAAQCPHPSASLSALAREGDLAFVAVGLVWAPLAGHGETWAFEKTRTGWRRVAVRRDWIA